MEFIKSFVFYDYNTTDVMIFLAAAVIFNIIIMLILYPSRMLHLLHKSYDKKYLNELNKITAYLKSGIILSFISMYLVILNMIFLIIYCLGYLIVSNTLSAFFMFIKIWLIPRNE